MWWPGSIWALSVWKAKMAAKAARRPLAARRISAFGNSHDDDLSRRRRRPRRILRWRYRRTDPPKKRETKETQGEDWDEFVFCGFLPFRIVSIEFSQERVKGHIYLECNEGTWLLLCDLWIWLLHAGQVFKQTANNVWRWVGFKLLLINSGGYLSYFKKSFCFINSYLSFSSSTLCNHSSCLDSKKPPSPKTANRNAETPGKHSGGRTVESWVSMLITSMVVVGSWCDGWIRRVWYISTTYRFGAPSGWVDGLGWVGMKGRKGMYI